MVPRDPAAGHRVANFMAGLGLWTPPASASAASASGLQDAAAAPAAAASAASGFRALDAEGIRGYVAARPQLCAVVGPPDSAHDWRVREVGDGNINFVYIVEGSSGGLCVKQALPYVRCVGESWPLTQVRRRGASGARMCLPCSNV